MSLRTGIVPVQLDISTHSCKFLALHPSKEIGGGNRVKKEEFELGLVELVELVPS